MLLKKKDKNSEEINSYMRKFAITAIFILTISVFKFNLTPIQALNENNPVDNNEILGTSDAPTDNSFTKTEVTIGLVNTSSGEIKLSRDKIFLKDIDIDIKNLAIYLSDIKVDENSMSDIQKSFRSISNQFSSDNGNGNPFSFSTTGHYFQLRNLNFNWQEGPNENLEVGLSYDNQSLMIREPIVTTGTPLGYATLSFGAISQGADKFSVSGSVQGLENLHEMTLDSAMDNFDVYLTKPSLFFFTPILGTHSFTLTDEHIAVEGVSSFGEILKQRKINANVKVRKQETNLNSLNPTDNIISISMIKFREKSVSVETPPPYNKFLIKNVNWHYDSIDQYLENLNANFKDVSISNASLENSSVSLKRLEMDWKNPRFSVEIPFLGVSSFKSNQIHLNNLNLKLENLEVDSMSFHENILENVNFDRFTAKQEMSRLGKFEIIVRGLKGTPDNLTIIQPNIALTNPGIAGFELNLDKLNLEEPTESNITKASATFNLPGSSKMTWRPRSLEPSNSQVLLSSFLIAGLLLFYRVSGAGMNSSSKGNED